MKILLISSSARGHAIAEALKKSTHNPEIVSICPSRNPGIAGLASEQHVLDILDFEAIKKIAENVKPDFAFIGPDDPIGMGLADELEDMGIPCIAPKKALARIESSKGFTRDLFEKYEIDASPRYQVFTSEDREEMDSFITELNKEYVVKYDGLKGGKGVKVSGDHLETVEEGLDYACECVREGGKVVIEEKLIGVEFSLISFVAGNTVIHTPAIQDHKRAYEGDTGPNTGGMGTYSDSDHSLPFLTEEEFERAKELNQITIDTITNESGAPYRGILFGGFIATKNGVRVIEYNARFGDPESLNILPLLESDFVDVCLKMIDGSLADNDVVFAPKATVCKYITPDCYPVSKDRKGEEVTFPEIDNSSLHARLYLGDIAEIDGSITLGGSRTAGIVGIADALEEAERIAQELCEKVEGPVRYRKDIGTKELVEERVRVMEEIRG